jgi:hypothetical protein
VWDEYYMAPYQSPVTHRLEYDFINENLVLASTGMTLAAGVAGIVGYFVTRVRTSLSGRIRARLMHTQTSKPTLSKTILTNIFPALAFLFSLLSIVITSTRHTRIKNSTCQWRFGMEAGANFHCTRELGVCLVVGSLKNGWGNFTPIESCDELHLVRTMLIPLTVVSAAVLGLGVARGVVGRKAEVGDAEERVRVLRGEE